MPYTTTSDGGGGGDGDKGGSGCSGEYVCECRI